MNSILTHLFANWKTTAQSLLSAWLAIFSALTATDAAGAVNFHPAKWFLLSGIIAKVLLGFIQKDAASAKILLFALLLPAAAVAQTATPPPAPIQNFYGAGVSYSVNASPAVAGTALYAHLLSAETGTYAFTAIDALPNTLQPFTVSSNIGAGVAQKVFTLGKVPVYMPTAAGISFNGPNTGWQWNGGVMASIHIKSQYYLMPTVRFLKSSVSNGTGYQPIVGVLFGWGQ